MSVSYAPAQVDATYRFIKLLLAFLVLVVLFPFPVSLFICHCELKLLDGLSKFTECPLHRSEVQLTEREPGSHSIQSPMWIHRRDQQLLGKRGRPRQFREIT